MSLPNLHYYYWACNIQVIQVIAHIQSDPLEQAPDWVKIEAHGLPFHSLVTSPLPMAFRTSHTNPVVAHTLKIWSQFRKQFGQLKVSLMAPIMTNHLFAPAQLDLSFRAWHGNGIRVIKDLYVEGIFASFAQLAEKFSLPQSHHFRYFQVRDFVRKGYHPFPELPPETPLDILLATKSSHHHFLTKGTITRIYGTLTNMNPQLTASIRTLWEEDLGTHLSDDLWKAVFEQVHSFSSCSRYDLIQFKIVHRAYFTKAKLAKIYPNTNPTCDCCKHAPETLIHMFWTCSTLCTF